MTKPHRVERWQFDMIQDGQLKSRQFDYQCCRVSHHRVLSEELATPPTCKGCTSLQSKTSHSDSCIHHARKYYTHDESSDARSMLSRMGDSSEGSFAIDAAECTHQNLITDNYSHTEVALPCISTITFTPTPNTQDCGTLTRSQVTPGRCCPRWAIPEWGSPQTASANPR